MWSGRLAGGGKWIRTLGPSRLILGEEKGRRSIRVVAKDAVPFHGGTSGSNPSCSAGESVSVVSFVMAGEVAKLDLNTRACPVAVAPFIRSARRPARCSIGCLLRCASSALVGTLREKLFGQSRLLPPSHPSKTRRKSRDSDAASGDTGESASPVNSAAAPISQRWIPRR